MEKAVNELDAPVIIAGAGPVGLALALGLSHHGIRSVVVEKKPQLSEHSKALLITTRTVEILRNWGVLDSFLAESPLRERVSVWLAGRPQPQATIDLQGSVQDRIAEPGVVVLPQNRTEALLLEAVKSTGLVEVLFDHELAEFEQDRNGVTCSVTHEGATRHLAAKFLIGCDGAHSVVRQRLGWKLQGKTYPTRILLADVRLSDERDQLPWPRLTALPKGVMGGIRFESQLWRIIATLNPDDDDDVEMGREALARRIGQLFGPGEFDLVWVNTFRIHCRTSPHFRRGRVFLAGDAAHINSPAGGQGMNAGIQDTYNLAWKLARALQHESGTALLASYEQERRQAVVSNVERFTDLLTRIAFQAPALLRAIVLRGVQLALHQSAIQKAMVLQLGMLNTRYTASALLRGDSPLLGTMAIDGEVVNARGERKRLLDLASRQPALLLFDDEHLPGWNRDEIEATLQDVPDIQVCRILPPTGLPQSENDWCNADGQLWKQWNATGDTVALLRPDGHIGMLDRRPSPVALRRSVQRALGLPV